MTWHEFLRYSKYIAVFYAIAFVIALIGIWMPHPDRFIYTAVMFFCAALAGNVALGIYHGNHKSHMKFAKAAYQQEHQTDAVVDITSDDKSLAVVEDDDGRPVLSPAMEEFVDEVVTKSVRKARGY